MRAKNKALSTRYLAVTSAGLANFFLGASSLYWREFKNIPPITLVAYRVTLSCITLALIITLFRSYGQFRKITLRIAALHCAASIFIAINWGTFIWSAINGNLLESALGYLLAPFITIVAGTIIYHERLTPNKLISISIAFTLTITLMIFSKTLNHLTYLLIATTWGLYTCLKKATPFSAVSGLFMETLFLAACLPLAAWLLGAQFVWPNQLPHTNLPIWLAGGVSIIPLLMFSSATGKIPLSLTGCLQFILPLTLLSIGAFVSKQETPTSSLVLIIATNCILALLIGYDIKTSTPKINEEP